MPLDLRRENNLAKYIQKLPTTKCIPIDTFLNTVVQHALFLSFPLARSIVLSLSLSSSMLVATTLRLIKGLAKFLKDVHNHDI